MGDLMNMTPAEALLACSLLAYLILMVISMWRAGRQMNPAAVAATVGAAFGMMSTMDLIRAHPDDIALDMLRFLAIAMMGCVGLITLWRSEKEA
jgi:hypothetical protein